MIETFVYTVSVLAVVHLSLHRTLFFNVSQEKKAVEGKVSYCAWIGSG